MFVVYPAVGLGGEERCDCRSLCFSSVLFFSIISLAVCWKGVVDEKQREKVCVCLFIYLSGGGTADCNSHYIM